LAIVVLFFSYKETLEPPEDETPDDATYSVTYKSNGSTSGSVPVDPSKYTQGKTVTVLGKLNLVKTGSTFDGWNTKADGSGTDRLPGATFVMGSENVVLSVQWMVASSLSVVGVTVSNALSAGNNAALIVCYTSGGGVDWAQAASGELESMFSSVAVDSAETVYAAGNLAGNTTLTFGIGTTATASGNCSTWQASSLLLKFDTAGAASWARVYGSTLGGESSYFSGVSATSSYVYAGGSQNGTNEFKEGTTTYLGPAAANNAIFVQFSR